SESYAKEELRAEIASLMIGDELQIGHDPGQHAAYVKSWVKVLKDDPKEILRAAKDAEAISSYLLSHEKEKTQEAPQNAPESDTAPKEGNDNALPLKLAEKLAERFNNAEDRAKFMEKIQSRLTHEKPDTEIKIKETNTVVVSKKGLKQDTDLER
ncbi:zincin-like metallopeptidase domain-containing protein, partial [Klebsiella pneumoniae]